MKILMGGSCENNNRSTSTIRKRNGFGYWAIVAINSLSLLLGSVSANLLSRFYFMHGGSSRWVSTWVQSAGFPILLIPIYLCYFFGNNTSKPFSSFSPKLSFLCTGLGLLMGLNNFCYSWGISYLSVSTASLLLSCQLAFNLLLCVVLVRQKLHFSNVNCVVLLTTSSVLLALGSSHDRPSGVSRTQYFLGFLSTISAALLFAVYLPLLEMIYTRVSCELSYRSVMEMQFVMEIAATVFSTVGMVGDGGFGKMKREGEVGFDLGVLRYWLTVGFSVVCWQFCFMGTAGMVFLGTSLMCGICMTAMLPVSVVAAVVVYGDELSGEKVVSTVLCVWGFCSYLYGEHIMRKKEKETKVETGKVDLEVQSDAVGTRNIGGF